MMARSIESVNVIIAQYSDEVFGSVTVHPQNGSVGFGSGLQGWGFTLEDFAVMWHDSFGLSKRKMMKKLWGDNFYDPHAKKWVTAQPESGKRLERGFVQFVLRPLIRLFSVVASGSCDVLHKFVAKNGLTVTTPNNVPMADMRPKDALKSVMQTWFHKRRNNTKNKEAEQTDEKGEKEENTRREKDFKKKSSLFLLLQASCFQCFASADSQYSALSQSGAGLSG